MSDLGFNKIAAAVLATGLAIVFMNQISDKVFEPVAPKTMGYKIEPAVDGGPEVAAVILPPQDWGTVLPAADVAKGEAVFAKCASCHKPTDENGTGPGLLAVIGRKPASHVGTPAPFKYSDGMTAFGASHAQWTFDELEQFLTKPQKYVDGTKMTFTGLKNVEDRINVIAYLHTLNASLPIPAPDAARAAAMEAALHPAPGAAAAAAGAAQAAGAAPAAAPAAGAAAAPKAGAPAAPAAAPKAAAAAPAAK